MPHKSKELRSWCFRPLIRRAGDDGVRRHRRANRYRGGIAAIGAYSAFGQAVRNSIAGMAKGLSSHRAGALLGRDRANAAIGRANGPKKTGMCRYKDANGVKK